jgi:hypothetical protein
MNEFVARNGLIALDSSSISGPLTVSSSVSINSGNLTVSAPSFYNTTFRNAGQSVYNTYEPTGYSSWIIGVETQYFLGYSGRNILVFSRDRNHTIGGIDNNYIGFGHLGPTANVDIAPSSTARASLRIRSGSAPTSPNDGDIWNSGSILYLKSGLNTSGSSVISGSLTITEGITGSFFGTSSWAQNAATASSADSFLVRGTLTAQTIVVQTITSSIDFVTGSTKFGSLSSDRHQFTGSVSISGSSPLLQLGSTVNVGNFTNPVVTFGSNSSGFYLDSDRILIKAGGQFAGGFSSDGYIAGQVQIQGNTPNNLTTAMYIPYRLNAIGLLGGLGGNSAGDITLITSGSSRLFVSSSGNIGIGTTSPAYQVDVTGQARVQGIFYNTGYNASVQRLGFNSGIAASNLGYIIASSNGVFRLVDAAEADFTRLQFGGTTTSFPALQRTGSALSVVDATGASGSNLLIGTLSDTGQRLQVNGDAFIKGSGATNASYALSIVNNSSIQSVLINNAGQAMFGINTPSGGNVKLETDGVFRAWTNIEVGQFGTLAINTTQLAKTATGADFFQFINNSSHTATVGTYYFLQLRNTVNPTSGNAVVNGLNLNFTINQTGGANGITRGLYVNPTLTAAADWRSIEWSNNATTAPSASWGLYGAGTAPNYLRGNVSIGTLTTGSALTVSGSSVISGSLVVTQGISGSFSGSYVGDGSQLTGIVVSAASTASYVNTLNQNVLVTGGVSASSYLYSEVDITAQQNLRSVNSSGDEGGEIFLNKAVTNTTLNGGVTIDVWQNRLRFFEQGGTARGYYIDISNGGAGVSTNLVGGGGSTSPGGSNTQIQYNNGGAFGGVSVLTYDGTTLRATGSFTGSLVGSLLGTASFATTSSFTLNIDGGFY